MRLDKLLALAEKFEEELEEEREPFSYDEDPYYDEPWDKPWDMPEPPEDEDSMYPYSGRNYYLVIEPIGGQPAIHSGWKNQEAANKAKRQLINERKIKGTIKVVPAMEISYRPYRLNPESDDSWLYGHKGFVYQLNEDEDWVDPQDEKMGKASSAQLTSSLIVLAEKFLSLVKADKFQSHGYDPICQCPDCIETEHRLRNEIKKEKSGPKHPKPKHTK
jgi:hypothetical protein